MIVSVIHIHTVYWALAPVTPDLVRHLAYLIDIPIFFFISGYLFSSGEVTARGGVQGTQGRRLCPARKSRRVWAARRAPAGFQWGSSAKYSGNSCDCLKTGSRSRTG